MKSIVLLTFILFIRITLTNKAKEFCLYNSEGVIKIYDPIYIDDKGNTVYAETIEEYAKFLGPTWYGVSFCGNNTIVNSMGLYFDISKSKIQKREVENTSEEKEEKNFFRGNNTLLDSDYKKLSEDYINSIYDKLQNSKKRCIPLTSINPGFNPYHKNLTIGVDAANVRYALGNIINIDKNIFNDIPSGITKCSAVNNCKGCNVVCNAIITASIEKQYSISDSNGITRSSTYGTVTENSSTFTDEISNTMEVANSLSDSGSISQSNSESKTNSLEQAVSLTHSNSTSNTNERSTTHIDEHSESHIHGVSEEKTHATTNTDIETREKNWNKYSERSKTQEYSHLSMDDYKRYDSAIAKVEKPDYVKANTNKYSKRNNLTNSDFKYEPNLKKRVLTELGVATAGVVIAGLSFVGSTATGLWQGYEAHEANNIQKDMMAQEKELADLTYNQTDYWSLRNENQTDFWGLRNENQTDFWNLRNENQTDFWNLRNENQTDYWGVRNEQTQYNLANFDFDIQDYIADRNDRSQLVMALAGTHTTSNTDVEGSSEGGAIINSHEYSRYDATTYGVMDQDQTTNGYSNSYMEGHQETSSREDSRSDTISKIVSNTDATENSWSLERTNQTTTTNGRTFGSSNSYTTNDEKSFEESKNLSIENTISKINSSGNSYQINQSITNNPIDDKCYSYIITPKIKTEAVVWACLNSNEYNDEKVKFIHSESMIEYFKDYFIINRSDCSDNNNVRGIKLLDNYAANRINNANVKNFLLSNEYIYLNHNDVLSIDSDTFKWFFGILPNGRLALCQSDFDIDHAVWFTDTEIPENGIINASRFNIRLRIAKNGHLIMEADNILASYNKLDDDLFTVNTKQTLVIWDSLPKHLPYTVGYYGTKGYTLILNPIDSGADCEVLLYDSLGAVIWKISSQTSEYKGYAFPIEYNLPLKFNTLPINNDSHNKISKNVKVKYNSMITFDCNTTLFENEALSSPNGNYIFYLQPSGNLVLKQYHRTLWSSNTAFVEPFDPPYHLAFSRYGELIYIKR